MRQNSLATDSMALLVAPLSLHLLFQKLDIRDNPDLTMPPKPVQQVKGSGAEWYNIDFDPEILKKGAVVSSAQVIKGQRLLLHVTTWSLCVCVCLFLPSGAYTRQKVRFRVFLKFFKMRLVFSLLKCGSGVSFKLNRV